MALTSPVSGSENIPARHDAVAQLRDLGERLKHLLVRYDLMVGRVTDGLAPVADLVGRMDWLNLQLAAAAEQLQEIILLEGESARAVSFARGRAVTRATGRRFVVHRAIEGRV